MFLHLVHFWLRDDLSAAERADFLIAIRTLPGCPQVLRGSIRVPAGVERPVVDNSWDYQLHVEFADRADHDAYQVDPLHQAFLEGQKPKFAKVMVLDTVEI